MKNNNNNNKHVKRPRIKKGDQVIVIAGADKDLGKSRRVLAVYPQQGKVLVEGVRTVKRAYKKGANPRLPDGGIHEKQLPVSISNVMLADPKSGEATRVGINFEEGSKGETLRVRYAKKSGEKFK